MPRQCRLGKITGWSFNGVGGVGVDQHDNVFVFNRGEHPMIVFDRQGNFLRSWGRGQYVVVYKNKTSTRGAPMVPPYAARIEDVGPRDFVKVDSAACSHTALLSTVFRSRLGPSSRDKILDLKDRKFRGCRVRGVAYTGR
jgi:hypothetical protein